MLPLELRNNEEDLVLAVMNVYAREYGSSDDFQSLGLGGECTFSILRTAVAPVAGSPERRLKSRTQSQGFRAVAQLKANLDRLNMLLAHPGMTSSTAVSREFYKDERQPINLSVGPAFTAIVPEGNFSTAAQVRLYSPTGVLGVLNTDYSVNIATGEVDALLAPFQSADCSITYAYMADADELTYGGLLNCEAEKELELKFICRTNECREDEEDFVQHVIQIYRAETEGDFEFVVKSDAIDPVSITFIALDDPTKPKSNRLFRHYQEISAA